jgi:predicted CopG family antitoxin
LITIIRHWRLAVLKKMTISVEEDVYNTLAPFEARQTLGDYITHLVRSRNAESDKFDVAARSISYKDHSDYLRANTPRTIEEAEAEAERKYNDPNRKPFSRFYGILEGDEAYGDGMEYQRKMRDEWPD